MTEIIIQRVYDPEFVPDTIEKCYVLLAKLGAIAIEAAPDYPGKIVWPVWGTDETRD